jgi:phosphotriesterase-related protein
MGHVMTVTGPVRPDTIGITSCHEHLLIDLTPWLDPPLGDPNEEAPVTLENLGWQRRDPFFRGSDNNRLDDAGVAVDELRRFKASGGTAIVDLTSTGLGPQPARIREIAEESGVLVVLGCGYYRVVGHPTWLLEASVEEVRDALLQQVLVGIDGTSVRPGIIGELGTSDVIHPSERRVLQAGALVLRVTGFSVNIHTDPWARLGQEALDLFEAAGGDPTRVVISHLDHAAIDLPYLRALAGRGAVVEFDGFGCEWYLDSRKTWLPRDSDRLAAIATLVDEGYRDQIVVGSDTCRKVQLTRYGGWGYAHIPQHVAPMMRWFGLGSDDVAAIVSDTPRRLLTIA